MKKLFLSFAAIIIAGVAFAGCAAVNNADNSGISFVNSVQYTCVVENCTDPDHAHRGCEVSGCDILNNHSHEGAACTLEGCTESEAHQHGGCIVSGCTESGSHSHNGECGLTNCATLGGHTHDSCCD